MSEVNEKVKLDAAIKALALRAGACRALKHDNEADELDAAIRILSGWPRWEPLIEAAGNVDAGNMGAWITQWYENSAPANIHDQETESIAHSQIIDLLDAIPAKENAKAKEG